MRHFASFLICVALVTGCASIKPTPVETFGDNPEGIPYYDGSHYLLVYPDGLGNLKWELLYLADPTKKREYRTESFLSSVEATLKFSNGLLTDSETTSDASAVPKAFIGAVEKVLTAGIANDIAVGENKVPAPLVYKLWANGDEITFIGDRGSEHVVNVTVTSPPKQDGAEEDPK